MNGKIQIIQGGQWGSEAKGHVAAYFCRKGDVDIAVRTGATNAGHTVYYQGTPIKMQQLPVGWVNPTVKLVLGAGAIIDPIILAREIQMVSDLTGENVGKRLVVDYRAAIHLPDHATRSAASGRHHAIGATGKGCSEALTDKIRRRGDPDYLTFAESVYALPSLQKFDDLFDIRDTEALLNHMYDQGATIQLEGTQGTLLDLNHGPYPYVTHKPTLPAQWLVECGLSPNLLLDIIMVMRTYPIRVAGNSGPMMHEISWVELADRLNAQCLSANLPPIVDPHAVTQFMQAVGQASKNFEMPGRSTGLDMHLWSPVERHTFKEAASELHKAALESLPDSVTGELAKLFEMTTVTKKLRRIAHTDVSDFDAALRQCRPDKVFVTFMNYTNPARWYAENVTREDAMADLQGWLDEMQFKPNPVQDTMFTHVSYGPDDQHVVELY